MKTETMYGIEYIKPEVTLLQQTGIGTAEYAARTCYDSFDKSENSCIRDLGRGETSLGGYEYSEMNHIESSKLLEDLAWTHFHHSILEHANLTYLIKGTSRGVLQEHARHRIQSLSVRSTRYTMQPILNAFVASKLAEDISFFVETVKHLNMFVTKEEHYCTLQIQDMYLKLAYQCDNIGLNPFIELALSKDAQVNLWGSEPATASSLYQTLQACKNKRNVGDAFKHIVTDNWKVDMVVTMNLRALKNYLTLRDSGAAYFQMRWLAQAVKEVTPEKYLNLIVKKDSNA